MNLRLIFKVMLFRNTMVLLLESNLTKCFRLMIEDRDIWQKLYFSSTFIQLTMDSLES